MGHNDVKPTVEEIMAAIKEIEEQNAAGTDASWIMTAGVLIFFM